MKKTLFASAAMALALTGAAAAQEAKVGILVSFTGPIESLTPAMAASAELALKEASDSGALLGGTVLTPVRADATCIDAQAANAAAERLVAAEGIVAMYGPDCSGVTTSVANAVTIPNGVTTISPSATSPALSNIDDNGYFFRTSPSDARQGQVLADIVMDRGIEDIAVTYTNNDYGKGLADAFISAYEAKGGKVVISAAHEDGKGDYSAEVGALAAAGSSNLAVFGYVDQGGLGIMQTSIDTGAFDMFVLGDGMYGDSLIDALGSDLDGAVIGAVPGADAESAAKWAEVAEANGIDAAGAYTGQSYDAAALIALAAQAAGSTDRAAIQSKILDVANAPGEKIAAGEIEKGLKILADGGEIDFVGATNVELIGPGEAAGTYREYEITDGAFKDVKLHQ